MIFGLIILGVLAILALSVWIEPETETEPMKFEADSGQDSVLILREYMRNHSRRKTHQNQIVKEVLLTDNMTDKKKIIQKALRLARNGERLGFLTDTGLGDYTLKPVRSRAQFKTLATKYMRQNNLSIVTLEQCSGYYGHEIITLKENE